MTLPNDIARCSGVGSDEEGWREGCEDCQRRTAESTSAVVAHMLPPAFIVFFCESRIAPSNALSSAAAVGGRLRRIVRSRQSLLHGYIPLPDAFYGLVADFLAN